MVTIPKLGKYVNDEIAYELHKLKTDEVIREYHEKYYFVNNALWYNINTMSRRPFNYKYLWLTMSYSYISSIFGKKYEYVSLLPRKYWYSSGINYNRGYINRSPPLQ